MIDIVLIAQCILCALLIFGWIYTYNKQQSAADHERELWLKERQQLLDRIQAPSFDHYKAAEVRVLKAQKPEEEKKPFEYV